MIEIKRIDNLLASKLVALLAASKKLEQVQPKTEVYDFLVEELKILIDKHSD